MKQSAGSIKKEPCNSDAKRLETDLRKTLDNARSEDEYISNFIFPAEFFQPNEENQTKEDTRYTGTSYNTYMYGQRRCPKRLTKKKLLKKNLMYKSTCPWYVELTVNHDRYPTYMATAKCSCKNCFNGNGTKYSDKSERRCREVKRRVIVLRQTFIPDPRNSTQWVPQCTNGVKDYEKGYEDISIGCTCAVQSSDEEGNQFADM